MTNVTYALCAIDCPDPVAMATFYSALCGLRIAPYDQPDDVVGWVELLNGDRPTLAFQRVAPHQPPTWPEGDQPQRLHLDFLVDDLDEGQLFALSLGATLAAHQPGGSSFRVFLDPLGHPFCLVLRAQ